MVLDIGRSKVGIKALGDDPPVHCKGHCEPQPQPHCSALLPQPQLPPAQASDAGIKAVAAECPHLRKLACSWCTVSDLGVRSVLCGCRELEVPSLPAIPTAHGLSLSLSTRLHCDPLTWVSGSRSRRLQVPHSRLGELSARRVRSGP